MFCAHHFQPAKNNSFFSLTLLLNPALGCNGSLKDENSASVPSYPTLLSPQISACISEPLCTRPMVVSHRGEGGNDPENAIAGIKDDWVNLNAASN
ncbi:MAG: hypothetical protein CMH56_08620 [Myxococcales bacterium]|nr:hypothetical protein [Myxococcales bacterium]|tara:strand:+ start:2944 stop:3231 length:288 start_codon:yes stop_codon:yes gene_type:complete